MPRKSVKRIARDLKVGDVANLLLVGESTVTKWIDSGRLESWRLPLDYTRGDRRVPKRAFLEFCRREKIPIPPGMEPAVLLVGCPQWAEPLSPLMGFVRVVPCSSAFDAGMALKDHLPFGAVLDLGAIGTDECRMIARSIRSELKHCSTLALVPTDRPARTEPDFTRAVSANVLPAKLAWILQQWLHNAYGPEI